MTHQVFRVTARDKFLLLGCDGFFGVFAPDDAVRRTQQLMQEGRNAKATCNRLIFEVGPCSFWMDMKKELHGAKAS